MIPIPIILINLEQDTKRLECAMNQLSVLDLPITRFPAIRGSDLDLHNIPISWYTRYLIDHPNKRCSHQQINSVGGIGCYLSHITIWNTFKDTPNGILVFEDDLSISKDTFKENIEQLLSNIPQDCDLLSFGYLGLLEKQCFDSDVTKSNSLFFGLQGYYISSKGMYTLLQHAYPIENHIDAFVSLVAKQGLVNLYFTKHSFVQQSMSSLSNVSQNYCYKCLLPDVSIHTFIFIVVILVFLIALYIFYKYK